MVQVAPLVVSKVEKKEWIKFLRTMKILIVQLGLVVTQRKILILAVVKVSLLVLALIKVMTMAILSYC